MKKDFEGGCYSLIKTLPQNLPGGTEETHEKSQSWQPVSRPGFKPSPLIYKTRMLLLCQHPQCLTASDLHKLKWTIHSITTEANLDACQTRWDKFKHNSFSSLNSRPKDQETSLHLKILAGQHSQSLCSIWWISNRKEIHLTCTGRQSLNSALHAKWILIS
jgi:hypothetical protein